MFKHILIPTDGSPVANKAAKRARNQARRQGHCLFRARRTAAHLC